MSKRKHIPLFKINIDPSAAGRAVRDVARSGFINEGVQVTELTHKLSEFLGSNKLVLTNSCTSALTLALHLSAVGPGDDVISTSMTCVATNTPIVTSRANVRWADIDRTTGMLTAESVKRCMTDRTKAVIVVAWAGLVPDLESIKKVCADRDVRLIVDAAHAFGASCDDSHMHDHADFVCYSFQAIKHFTTGDGGALICANDDDYRRAKRLKWFGIDRDGTKDASGNWKSKQWDVPIEEAGYKFNMNNVAAAIGLSNLKTIGNVLGRHLVNSMMYNAGFAQEFSDRSIEPTLSTLKTTPGSIPSYWVYPIVLNERSTVDRDTLLQRLNSDGIGAGVVHVPNHYYEAFENRSSIDPAGLHETEAFSRSQLNLPCGAWVKETDVARIIKKVVDITTEKP